MMKNFGVFTLILLLGMTGFSHGQWIAQNSNTIYPLLGIAFHDSLHGISVGGSTNGGIGVVTTTFDGGANWTSQFFPNRLRSVSMVDSLVAYACGDAGYLLKSTDGGQNWAAQNTGSNLVLHSVYFLNRDTGYVSGAAGLLLRTRDGGNSWQPLNSGTNLVLYDVHFPSDTVGYVVGNAGEIRRTTDAGDSWIPMVSGTISMQHCVYFVSEDEGYSTGNAAEILKTTNGGLAWNLLNSGNIPVLYDILFPQDSIGFAVGNAGLIITSTNAGVSWTPENSGTILILYGIAFAQGQGYVCGNSGYIAKRVQDSTGTVSIENRLHPKATMSPNPATDAVLVDWSECKGLDCQVKEIFILNSSGQLVFREDIGPAAPSRRLIPLQGFATGIYCVGIRTDRGAAIERLLVD